MLKPKGHSAPRSSTLKGANVAASTRREQKRTPESLAMSCKNVQFQFVQRVLVQFLHYVNYIYDLS